jgi:hypothetical protein
MTFRIERFRLHVLPMRTRFPFRYGIACMTAVPHVFVNVDLVVDGRAVTGLSSEGLPPKWFTKQPDTPLELELAEMIAVLQNATRIARLAAERDTGFFRWWSDLYAEQSSWASVRQCPPLSARCSMASAKPRSSRCMPFCIKTRSASISARCARSCAASRWPMSS